MLRVGVALAATTVLLGAIAGATGHPAIELSLQILSLMAALLFLLGLAPPSVLRMAWRRSEEAALRTAELEMMKATTPEEVATPILEPIARMLGGQGAVLADSNGGVIAVHGFDDEVVTGTAIANRVAAMDATEPALDGEVLAVPLRRGWLAVQAAPYTPAFGTGEMALGQRVGLVIDMALERAESVANDRATRAAVEQAHAEMESMLYTVSHDLKSPLLTVLGYIDLLRAEGVVLDPKAEN